MAYQANSTFLCRCFLKTNRLIFRLVCYNISKYTLNCYVMVKFTDKEATVPSCQQSPEKRPLRGNTENKKRGEETTRKRGNKREEEMEVGNAGNVPTCPVPMRSHFNKLNEDIAFRHYDCTMQTPGF